MNRHLAAVWLCLGVALLALQALVWGLSLRFPHEPGNAAGPVLAFTFVMVLAGAVYLCLPWLVARSPPGRRVLVWVLGVGLAMRLLMLPSQPILEDDFYRYLWDGAVLGAGVSPYEHAPAAIARGAGPVRLEALAKASGPVLGRVNYPELRSVYPPLAQAGFALAHWLEPWSLDAWRWLLLALECSSLGLLLVALRDAGRSALWVVLYWWNPLVVRELINAAHMDAMLLPLLLGTLVLARRRRFIGASTVLALATGTKLWPIFLLPLLVRQILAHKARVAACVTVFMAVVLAQAIPVLRSGLDAGSGFVAYSTDWEMNDALFMLVAWSMRAVAGSGAAYGQADMMARLLVLALVSGLSLAVARRRAADEAEMASRYLLVTAVLFLLSPAQFPWYYVWMVPFLALHPRYSLLSLTALLPLYYTRFYLDAAGQVALFDHGVVWLEYLPVFALAVWEWRTRGFMHGRAHAP